METYTCTPACGPLSASVAVPGSKSITNRALVVAALANGDSVLTNVLFADDTRLMIEALRSLGIAVTADESGCAVEVTGCRGHLPASEARLLCGNAGTVMRFCTAMVATAHGEFDLDGTKRMRQRPIGQLVEVLQALGTGVEYLGEDGRPPLRVHARHLRGGHVAFVSPESSQLISSLLMAAPCARNDVLIDVSGDVPSIPYLKITTGVMDRFGAAVVEQFSEDDVRFIVPAPQQYRSCTFPIEPDASNATYFLAAPAVAGGRVTVKGLGTSSMQGDSRFVDVLEQMGCRVERGEYELTVIGPTGGESLRGIDIDLNDMPDTVPTLAAIAPFASSPTTIRNVASLRVKECDRIDALCRELAKLGVKVEQWSDGFTVHPTGSLRPVAVDTYDDHRMAMSFALVGLKCQGLVINNPGCCNKTFPDFFDRWEGMQTAG